MACLEEGYQRRQQVQGHHPAAATHLINISRPVQPQQDGGTTSSHCTTVMSNGTSASNKHEAQPVRTLCKLLNTPGKVLLQHSMPIAVLELAHCVCQPIECVCVCVRPFLPVAAGAAQLHPVSRCASVTLTRRAYCQPLSTTVIHGSPVCYFCCNVAVPRLQCRSRALGW